MELVTRAPIGMLVRLREVASRDGRPFPQLVGDLVPKLTPHGSDNDIAILGMRWTD
jgi:hypothetical protein